MTAQRSAISPRIAAHAPASASERVRPWLLMALVAIVIGRPLLPSEGVSWIGDGQPFNLLTMLVAVVYLGFAIVGGGFARRLNLADATVAVLVVACTVAALIGAQHGSPRFAINMLFEWVALGLIYFLTRQLVYTPRETRALVALMISLAVVMSGYGLYQVLIGLPATRAAYAENPDQALATLGQWFPPGSPERRQFEDRLASSEPLATFALANSLAGFLAPWLVIALAIGLRQLGSLSGPSRRGALARAIGFAVCIAMIVACALLTKSRSAYVAMAAGIMLVPWFDRGLRPRFFSRRFVLLAVATLLLAIGAAVTLKGLDVQVLTEAKKSLGYRLEYWQSTLAMIGRHPWLGVGPGNFQDYYTQFKLPQASEEIRDPHNFLLEVWATAGTFALVALGQLLGVLAWRTWNLQEQSPEDSPRAASESPRSIAFMVVGGALGFVLAFLVGPSVALVFSEYQLAGGLVIFAAVAALAWPWITGGTLAPRLPALGVLVLLIHLLAAGGIAYPGVAGTLWILTALALNASETAPIGASRRRAVWAPALGLLIVGAAAAGCYYLAYTPVLRGHAALGRASDDRLAADARINLLIDAAEADPLSADPWLAIAEIESERLKQDPANPKSNERFVKATARVLELRPHSSAAWRQIGRWYQESYKHNRQPAAIKAATVCFRRAVELYPNFAALRGEYALALLAQGDQSAARRQAEIAGRLDNRTSHADKKLSPQLREQLDQLDSAPR